MFIFRADGTAGGEEMASGKVRLLNGNSDCGRLERWNWGREREREREGWMDGRMAGVGSSGAWAAAGLQGWLYLLVWILSYLSPTRCDWWQPASPPLQHCVVSSY